MDEPGYCTKCVASGSAEAHAKRAAESKPPPKPPTAPKVRAKVPKKVREKATRPYSSRSPVVGPKGLTQRERNILQYAADGVIYAKMAAQMECSLAAVQEAAKSLRSKLDATTITHAVAKCFRMGLLK